MNRDDPPMPRYGKTAVELLDSKYAEPHSLSSKYGTRFALGIFGIGMIIGDNWAKQRPMKAGTWCVFVCTFSFEIAQMSDEHW